MSKIKAASNKAALALRLLLSFPALFSVTTLLTATTNADSRVTNQAVSVQSDWIYTARPGDSVKSIGKRYLADANQWSALLRYNNINNTGLLQPGSLIRIPVSMLKSFPQPATLRVTQGKVWLRRAHTNPYIPALSGLKINIGDELKTLEGFALIIFADGSDLRIAKNSIIIFNSLTHYGKTGMVDTRFRLNKGGIRTNVTPRKGEKSRYEVSTPSAVAAVRGTSFRLRVENHLTTAEVTEGSVLVSNASTRITLQQGQAARIGATGGVIPIVLLPPPEIRLPEVISKLPFTFDWPPIPGADSYIIELSRQGPNELPLLTDRLSSPKFQLPQFQLPQLVNGNYQLTARATDPNNIQGVNATIQFKVDQQAEPAELIAPLPDAVQNQPQPEFTWQADTNLRSSLEIAMDADFKDLFSRTTFHQQQSGTSERPLPAGEYYWRVVTMAGGNTFAYSDTRFLTIRVRLGDSRVIAVNYLEDQVKVFWKRVKHAERYIVQLAEDELFQRLTKVEELSTTSATLRLVPGKSYWVRVKPIGNEFYTSTYGEAQLLKLQF